MAPVRRVARGANAARRLIHIDRKERSAAGQATHYDEVMLKRNRAAPSLFEAQDDDLRWDTVVARDASQADAFYFSVASTGIYCRPGCPARLPKRSNVAFYATPDDAERAGFRACKRCHPRSEPLAEHQRRKVMAACRAIATADAAPSLRELAEQAGLSPHHFHRLFRQIVGVTPKAYADAHRQKQIRINLKEAASVTQAIHESGFNASSRFYANSNKVLGMTPTDYRQGGTNVAIRYAIADCSLGKLLVAASDAGVCAIYFGDDAETLKADLHAQFPNAETSNDKSFATLTQSVIRAVEAPERDWDLPLDIRGTAFQHRVWQALRDIPPGETRTYAQIAEAIGSPKAVRAVGTACGANNISVAIPCHRVVRTDGTFPDANYRWGINRKRALLDREAKKVKRTR